MNCTQVNIEMPIGLTGSHHSLKPKLCYSVFAKGSWTITGSAGDVHADSVTIPAIDPDDDDMELTLPGGTYLLYASLVVKSGTIISADDINFTFFGEHIAGGSIVLNAIYNRTWNTTWDNDYDIVTIIGYGTSIISRKYSLCCCKNSNETTWSIKQRTFTALRIY